MNIGLVGLGYMGGIHARSIVKSRIASLHSVCGVSLQEAESFVEKNSLKGTRAFASWGEFLDDPGLEALVIAVPPCYATDIVVRAAERRLPILQEKPMAVSLEDASRMAAALTRSPAPYQIAFHFRYGNALRLFEEHRTTLGRPLVFSGTYACNSLHAPWWRHKELSGGQLVEQAIHLIDMLLYAVGPAVSVSGIILNQNHRSIPDYTSDDTSLLTIRHEGGALSNVLVTNNAVPGKWELALYGVFERGTIKIDSADTAKIEYHDGSIHHSSEDGTSAYEKEVFDFLKRCRGEAVSVGAPGLAEGLASLRLAGAAFASSEAGAVPKLVPPAIFPGP